MNDIPSITQLDKTFLEFHPETWADVFHIAVQLEGWAFRGQSCAIWGLKTSLERSYRHISPTITKSHFEKNVLDRFMRGAHHFVTCLPDPKNTLEWLAMIQHHGGPTRLLDFTKSFYIAAFFALEMADSVAAVWCLNTDRLRQTSKEWLSLIGEEEGGSDEVICNKIIDEGHDILATIIAEPFRLNERLIAQQGVFVVPCSLNHDVEKCLFNTIVDKDLAIDTAEIDSSHMLLGTFPTYGKVLKIFLPKATHADARKALKNMNINAATLFPGLDGFARSLNFYDSGQ
ncbi:FRG domain-containing protein [Rhodoferax antarcticus]|uniref:FRG domain-containing protein n=1 Tax=Rhodoferax antarcticus TaxID=81479 RepID=UPI0022242553|nr:FRG domain-containing protein [Rhodoferax antarcticus]MCW2311314.1 hypothetical protein [Rhodoferax antarcticus]